MNELLWLSMMLSSFCGVLLAYRFFGRMGLYAWIPIATLVANIQVQKLVGLFGIESVTLGNIVYATSFLVTDILNENYGKKEAQRAVFLGFFSLLVMTLLMSLTIQFTPAPDDGAHEPIAQIFGFMPRLASASLLAYLTSQFHDVWAYQLWRKLKPSIRFIWLRNNASTAISQLMDTTIFCTVAFAEIGPLQAFFPTREIFWSVFWTTYVIKFIVAACDTPFLYLARWMHDRNPAAKEALARE